MLSPAALITFAFILNHIHPTPFNSPGLGVTRSRPRSPISTPPPPGRGCATPSWRSSSPTPPATGCIPGVHRWRLLPADRLAEVLKQGGRRRLQYRGLDRQLEHLVQDAAARERPRRRRASPRRSTAPNSTDGTCSRSPGWPGGAMEGRPRPARGRALVAAGDDATRLINFAIGGKPRFENRDAILNRFPDPEQV